MEESDLRQWFWRPQLYHLTNRPIFSFNVRKKRALISYPLFRPYAKRLFLGLLENHVLPELGAVFLELDLAFNLLLILARPIGLAGRFVLELDQLGLSHGYLYEVLL